MANLPCNYLHKDLIVDVESILKKLVLEQKNLMMMELSNETDIIDTTINQFKKDKFIDALFFLEWIRNYEIDIYKKKIELKYNLIYSQHKNDNMNSCLTNSINEKLKIIETYMPEISYYLKIQFCFCNIIIDHGKEYYNDIIKSTKTRFDECCAVISRFYKSKETTEFEELYKKRSEERSKYFS